MIAKIKEFFEKNLSETKDAAGQQASTEHQVMLASVALMIEIAKIDHQLDDVELDKIREISKDTFSIDETSLQEVIALAKDLANDSTSLYEFTALINDHFSEEQKYNITLSMWKVAYADGRADHYEEHLIRKVADLIYVPHMKFIEAKLEAKPS